MSKDSPSPSSREIKCPQCGRLTFYGPENPDRPFCSKRCRMIDLGEWASESYRVPVTSEFPADIPDIHSGEEDEGA